MESLAAIESFVKSAELGSFSSAARKLGLTPAAVSKNVATLERSLGVALFRRSTRSLTLTDEGAQFATEAARGVEAIKAAVASLRGQRVVAGTVRVSLAPAFGRLYVVPSLPALFEAYPLLTVDWKLDNRRVDLAKDGFDAAVGGAIDFPQGVIARELAPAHIVAVASPSYLTRFKAPSHPRELAEHDGIVLRSPQTGRIRAWPFKHANGEAAAFEPKARVVVDEQELIAEAAARGLGIGITGMPHALPHLTTGALVRVLPKWHADVGKTAVYYPSNYQLPAKTRAFIDHLLAYFKRENLAKRLNAS